MVKRISDSGFCYGVETAVRKAEEQAEKIAAGRKVYLFGDLANNRHVMAGFKHKGFVITEDIDSIAPGSTVIIRAHGVPKKIYRQLTEKNAEIIDCTCPKVKSIHRIVEEKSDAGYKILIVGKSGHPEVEGTFGWCAEGSALIVGGTTDFNEKENGFFDGNLCVVGQTTCKKAWWEEAVRIVSDKNPNAEIYDTICNVTTERITAAVNLARESDLMVVVGDEKSANSLELYDACREVCKKVLFFSSAETLANFSEADIIPAAKGITGLAGSASTPVEIIDEIHGFILFTRFLAEAKKEVEAEIDKYLSKQLISVKGKNFVETAVSDLIEQNKDGKRIRGAMIKLGEEIAAAPSEKTALYLPIAAAYELFQTAILIHDDIIDKSAFRRGKKTIHSTESDSHFGTSRAICIGDYGLFLANRILAESALPSEIFVKIMRLFSQIQLTTLEGEIMDVSLPYKPVDITTDYKKYVEIVDEIFTSKTAWYTLAGPVMLGAICGGADEGLLNLLKDIMLPLGVAFQIKDDLLGIYAREEVLGKPAISDLLEKKQTLLYGYAYKHANETERRKLDACYGNPAADENDLISVREIFTATGAKDYAENEIRRLSDISLELIDSLPPESRPIMRGLVSYQIMRKY